MKPVHYLACFLLPFAVASCGANPTGHQIPTEINVQRDVLGPDHSLYQHHDIMLEKDEFNEAFGLVGDQKVQLIGLEAELLMQEKQSKKKSSENTRWKQRVYPKSHWQKVNVFDISGIEPKESATRPSWTGERVPPQRCIKPLRERKIHRLAPDGKLIKSYRRPGSAI